MLYLVKQSALKSIQLTYLRVPANVFTINNFTYEHLPQI